MKTTKTKSIFFLILFLSFIFVSVSPFSPTVSANTTTTNISAGDIIKNFRFASIGDEPIVSRGAFNNKLRFEKQDEWTINRNTITPIDCYSVPTEDGGYESYLRYKIEARTRVNIFTNLIINQVSETFYDDIEEPFLAGTYKHYGCFGPDGEIFIDWEEYITWEHWDFGGSVIKYNARENVFSGPIAMEFEIAPSPLPDVFGDYAVNNWTYITVDSAGVIYNDMGEMSSDELPETVTLSPSVYDSELRNEYTQTDEDTASSYFDVIFDPMTYLSDPLLPPETFAEGIIPHSVGASLNPMNLDGTLPWDPDDPSGSMTGCRLEYDLNSLSPKVRKMSARLVYYETHLETLDVLVWDASGIHWTVQEYSYTDAIKTHDRDVALQVINRFIQPEIRVIFDIWTKVNIGALTPYYEQMKLAKPEEFYEELIWSSIAGGWGGSYQRTTAPKWFDIDPLFIIILIVVIIVVIFVVFKVIRGKQKAIGTVMFGRK